MTDLSNRSGDSFREDVRAYAGRIVTLPEETDPERVLAIEQFSPRIIIQIPIDQRTVVDPVTSIPYSVGDEVVVEVRSGADVATRVSRLHRPSEGYFVEGDDTGRVIAVHTDSGKDVVLKTVAETQFGDGARIVNLRTDMLQKGEDVGVYYFYTDEGAKKVLVRVVNSQGKR